jgi:hypothetical protein
VGRQEQERSACGRACLGEKAAPIDFSDQVGIYVLYAEYKFVYVGQTGKGQQAFLKRLRSHRSDDLAGRWDTFSWFGVRRVLKRITLSKKNAAFHPSLIHVLDQIEGILIHAAEPPLNRQRGRLKKTVQRYLQYSSPTNA